MSTDNESTGLNTSSERRKAKLESSSARKPSYSTLSQIPVHPLYTPDDLNPSSSGDNMEMAGEIPYLRGVHPNGYRSKLWTMRMFAGFGIPSETNERLKF